MPSVYFTHYQHSQLQELSSIRFSPHDTLFSIEVLKRYNTYGFAIIDFGQRKVNQEELVLLANILKLGKPVVLSHYAGSNNVYDTYGFNTITSREGHDEHETHRAFFSKQSQALHVDGTLQNLGEIPSSILACKIPAIEGGETKIFNAVGAFAHLVRQSPNLATPLLNPHCLTRIDINRSKISKSGPAFGFKGRELLSRFSVDNTSQWNFLKVPLLREALECLMKLTQTSSPFSTEFKLRSGEVVIMSNDRISHGRRGFCDKPQARRTMIRGLFEKRPSLR